MKYTMTHESITVVTPNGPVTVRKGHSNYILLRKALVAEDESKVMNLLTVKDVIREWSSGKFLMRGEDIFFGTDRLPSELSKRILTMITQGKEPAFLLRFWESLQENPSWRSVQQLFRFLENEGIPIDENGSFLAYKSVKPNLTDWHTGTIKNEPGSVHEMPRNKISDDPNTACHYGFHVGALEYAQAFGGDNRRIVIVEVSPADVVCVPYDSSSQKVRVCQYKVKGFHSGRLPSSTFKEAKEPSAPKKKKAQGGKKTRARAGDGDWGPLDVTHIKRLDAMDLTNLTGMHIVTLRRYASSLKVVNAYKLPGGKATLLKAILEARTE
jgi:hypothetical protein